MVKHKSIRAGIGVHIAAVSIPADFEQVELHPENVTPLSSYNWLPGRTIAVPGNSCIVIPLTAWPSKKMVRT